jgi:hypothetical protein
MFNEIQRALLGLRAQSRRVAGKQAYVESGFSYKEPTGPKKIDPCGLGECPKPRVTYCVAGLSIQRESVKDLCRYKGWEDIKPIKESRIYM